MRISVVIEDSSTCGMPAEHGLSLWIEACGERFLFDLGQGSLFAENARSMGIDVGNAGFAIVSHSHYDHGGGIGTFLKHNSHANVYVSGNAFTECYSINDNITKYIGLDKQLKGHKQIVMTNRVIELAPGLTLFPGCTGRKCFSPANSRILKMEQGTLLPDDFQHEQSLIIQENSHNVLVAGCAHGGILNIMAKAEELTHAPLTHVIAGMHLTGVEDKSFIDHMATELATHSCRYYTGHCTGHDAYNRLRTTMGEQISYISCGDIIVI